MYIRKNSYQYERLTVQFLLKRVQKCVQVNHSCGKIKAWKLIHMIYKILSMM